MKISFEDVRLKQKWVRFFGYPIVNFGVVILLECKVIFSLSLQF